MKEIEDFLRENKPVVKDDPAFLLKTRQKMEAVEGIKAEVDRQRCYGRLALIVALIAGLAIGAAATAIAYLYPIATHHRRVPAFRYVLGRTRQGWPSRPAWPVADCPT